MGRTAKNRKKGGNWLNSIFKEKDPAEQGESFGFYSQTIFLITLAECDDNMINFFVDEIFKTKKIDPNGYKYNFMFAHLCANNYFLQTMNEAETNKIHKYLNVEQGDKRIEKYIEKLKKFVSLMLQKDPELKKLVENKDKEKTTDQVNPMMTDTKRELLSEPVEPVKPGEPGRINKFDTFANKNALRRPRGGKFRRSKSSKNKTKHRRK